MTEASRAVGVGEFCGTEEGVDAATLDGADAFEAVEGSWEASNASGGDSTCCAVELKYRARLGRRNVGGSAEDEIRVSRIDLLTVLQNILGSESGLLVINSPSRSPRGCSAVFIELSLDHQSELRCPALRKNMEKAPTLQHSNSNVITAHHASE